MITHDNISINLNYEIIQHIASGGMGDVYKAICYGSDGFHKKVAIKKLLEKYCTDKNYVDMFVYEAKLLSEFTHENIVQIYQLVHNENNLYYIMEYVSGFSLRDFLDSQASQPMPLEVCIYITTKIAYALDYVYNMTFKEGGNRNILHRDIRPNNILISQSGRIKISDFGLAQENSFQRGHLVGTSAYVAPEVINNSSYSIQSDLYSLGLLLFETLAGQGSRGLDYQQALTQAKKGVVKWKLLPSHLSDELYEILQKLLAYKVEDRYSTVRELIIDLENFVYAKEYKNLYYQFIDYLSEN